jgi:spermidine synthase
MRSTPAAILVFCTSAAVLVMEILAGRLVAPYLGVSIETYTGIIGTVLAGIALGSAVGGRLADRHDPRPWLGPALVIGGILALASLPVVSSLGPALAGGGPVEIVVLTMVAFLPSAVVLSAVSPMTAKLRLDDLGETGSVVGGLSAAGTAGALVGTFMTGFVLIAAWPTRPIVVAVGLALVTAGVALWWRLGRRRGAIQAIPVALLVAGATVAFPVPCEVETAYFCASVRADAARPSGRTLVLDNLQHSYVDLDDPTHLGFRYTRLMAAVINAESAPGPLRALYLGGGGFTMPRWLSATRPGSESQVLEIDPDLVTIGEEQLGLRTGAGTGIEVVVGDARLALDAEPTDHYDVIVGDAFGGLSVPWHLTTVEFVRQLQRTMTPEGIYVANIIDGGPRRFVHAEAATLAEVFDHVAVIDPPAGDRVANHVLIASDRPLRLTQASIDRTDGRLVPPDELADRLRGVSILTDDHAPVDQLLTKR